MASKQAYKCKVELTFMGSQNIPIKQEKLVYIIIEHMYESYIMPVIYLSISIDSDLRAMLIDEKDTAKMFLRIQKYDAYSGTSLSKDYIKGQFTYFMSSLTPEYSRDLSDKNSNVDSNYSTITIGLLDMNIMNTVRKTFGGIVKNIDQQTLIYMGLEDTNAVIKTPPYNAVYESLIIPSITSRKDFLRFVYDKDPFYDTEYLYFIDFDKSYLLDRTGEAVSANDGQLNDILIDIEAVDNWNAYNEGMEIRNNAYFFYINPANTNVGNNATTEKVANQIISANDKGTMSVDLSINKAAGSTTKQRFERMDPEQAIVYKNAIESSEIVLELAKDNIDSRFITPNKAIGVSNYSEYSAYNGRYVLVSKREIIQGASKDFASLVTFRIRRLGNIQQIGSIIKKVPIASTSKTTSTSARRNSSSTSSNRSTKSSGISLRGATITSRK